MTGSKPKHDLHHNFFTHPPPLYLRLYLRPMYSKQQAAQLKQQFWTAFGKYMSPIFSAGGGSINWINYKTGEKDIYFRMHADNKTAYIGIQLTHKDAGLQALYFEQFLQLRAILFNVLHEEWVWQPHTHNQQGKTISHIYTEKQNLSIFKEDHWPQLISFFKPRIIALDAFWEDAQPVFEAMR